MYEYKAYCYNVVDGDTVDLDVDLGFGVGFKQRFRLSDIDAPETHGVKKDSEEYAAGLESTRRLQQLILDKFVIVQTRKGKKGKYGRYIANILTEDGRNVNMMLVDEGLAVEAEY